MSAISFLEFEEQFLSLYLVPSRAKATHAKMAQVLRQVRALDVDATDQLTTALAARYVAARSAEVCPNTVRGELGYLRAACNFAVEEGWLDRAPRWRRVLPRKSKPVRKALHSVADIGRVLAYLERESLAWEDHRTYALGSLLAHTGVRLGEALHAWVDDVDLRQGVFVIEPRRRLKTESSARGVPLCQDVRPILRDWIFRGRSQWLFPHSGRSGPWTSGALGRRPRERLVAAGMAVGVSGFTPLSLRHSFTTWGRRRWGIEGPGMRDILGHTDVRTHEHHYLQPEHLAELVRMVRRVSYREGSSPG